ncbi:tetratricopeptide repeat protein [Sneathiella sp. P13V-1]|uniref:tetratricopeptide repeat protein n=1 Tax=Sneathiella sp. P13V-1 TaxID=2697366 RepID=UPI00187B5B4D|nr:tetratricopeptide repeat protein [Sneathiella sp. P13V-1]MBE7637341.1 tetratricopeptide repeat protein [Sneathiella sp. P13V-1]
MHFSKIVLFSLIGISLSACLTDSSQKEENLADCIKGWSLNQRGQYTNALNLYDRCIEYGNLTEGNLSRTYRNIGIAYRGLKEYEKSIDYFNKSMSFKPYDKQNDYINRGNSWSDLKQYQKALNDYSMALEIAPRNGQAMYNRALVYERMGRLDDALSEYKLAVKNGYTSIDVINAIRRMNFLYGKT